MGYTFSAEWPTKAKLVEYLTGDYFGPSIAITKKALRGEVLWTLIEYTEDTPEYPRGSRHIVCFLLELAKEIPGWGYKPMDETVGPYFYTCPLAWFDLVPDPGGYATAWRAKVRASYGSKVPA